MLKSKQAGPSMITVTEREFQDLMIALYKASTEHEKDQEVAARIWKLRERLAKELVQI